MARKQKVYQVTITEDIESAFNLLKLHRINIAELCREAMLRRAEMIEANDLDEAIQKHLDQVQYLTKAKEKKKEEEKILQELDDGMTARINQVIETIKRVYEKRGYLSKPMVQRTCNVKKIDFKEVWYKLPPEWTANASPYEYDDVEGTKQHRDYVGMDFGRIPRDNEDKNWQVGSRKE